MTAPRTRAGPLAAARHPREAGFTLVEVMVALLIFGIIAAAGVAILSFSVRAQAAGGTRLDELSALNRTSAMLSADLGQAVNRPARDAGGTLLPAMVGETGGLTLVRGGWTNIEGAPRPSEQKVQWRLDEAGLVRVAWPMLDGAQPLDPALMLPDVRGFRLRYRYRGAWNDRWDGALGVPFPDAIEVSLVHASGVTYRQMFVVGTGYARLPTTGPTPQPTDTPDATA